LRPAQKNIFPCPGSRFFLKTQSFSSKNHFSHLPSYIFLLTSSFIHLSAAAPGYERGGTALPTRRHLAANAVPPRWQ